MKVIRGLVPARFLVMMSHLIIVITIFISLDSTVTQCLPTSSTAAQISSERTSLIVALSLTLVMFLIELLGFIIGFSMFNASQSLLSIGAHAGASVSLSFYLFDMWSCNLYWYIFGFCSALPAITELAVMFGVFFFKKGL